VNLGCCELLGKLCGNGGLSIDCSENCLEVNMSNRKGNEKAIRSGELMCIENRTGSLRHQSD
jgi:hypothetical protein